MTEQIVGRITELNQQGILNSSDLCEFPIDKPDPHGKGVWVRVEDRLPDEGVPVLTYGAGRLRTGYNMWGDMEWDDDDYYCESITHWQPLPEPPERP